MKATILGLVLSTAVFAAIVGSPDARAETRQDEAAAEAPAEQLRYTIDGGHSTVGFKVRHFTVSNVSGRFNTLSGEVVYDPGNLAQSGVEVTIDASSIDTEHEQRDGHLKSPDFLEVEKFPEITFKSTAIKKSGPGFVAVGDLTIHGVSKSIEVPFHVVGPIKDPLGLQRIGVEGSVTIDRRDFGLVWNRAMETGGLFVGHDVMIELSVEATRK